MIILLALCDHGLSHDTILKSAWTEHRTLLLLLMLLWRFFRVGETVVLQLAGPSFSFHEHDYLFTCS